MIDIEYHLKLLLNSTTLKITALSDCRDVTVCTTFKKKYSNIRVIKGFVKSKSLSQSATEVPLFSVPINVKEQEHKIYLCEVAVGNSLYVSKEYANMCQPPSNYDSFIINHDNGSKESSKASSNNYIDENYRKEDSYNKYTKDSLYKSSDKECHKESLRHKEDDSRSYVSKKDFSKYIESSYPTKLEKTLNRVDISRDGQHSPSICTNTSEISRRSNSSVEDLTEHPIDLTKLSYVIKDPSRINILYEVNFSYDQMLEQKEKGQCEMCQQNPSIMFCLAERASLCKYCDEGIHDNALTQRHARYYYDAQAKKNFITCSYHYDSIVEFYCETCMTPVCSLCKIHGNHSAPPNSTHKLIRFLDACDLIKEKMRDEDEDLKHREERVTENINLFKHDLEEFNKMMGGIKLKIEHEYKSAINELNGIIRKKYQIYNAMYVEKLVVREKIEKVRNYIKDSEGGQNVRDYKAVIDAKSETIIFDDRVRMEKVCLDGKLQLNCETRGAEEKYVERARRHT